MPAPTPHTPPPAPASGAADPAPQHAERGLHGPTGALGLLETRGRFSPGRTAFQAVGFLIGVGLFAWCVTLAFGPESRGEMRRLLDAPAGALLALFALVAVSCGLNGFAFWVTLRPLHRLRLSDMIAVNAIASFLAYLPFKLGAVVRVIIHRRRDGVPFRDIVPWLAAFGALSLATLLPLLAAAMLRGAADAVWVVLSVVGVLACNALGVALGRAAQRTPWLARLSLGSWRIVRHPGPVVGCAAAKVLDIAVHAARFALAASIFGHALPPDQAALFAVAYFLIGSASPVGMFGMREGGVVLLGLGHDRALLAQLVVTLSAIEAITLLAMSVGGIAWLRPSTLLRARGPARVTA